MTCYDIWDQLAMSGLLLKVDAPEPLADGWIRFSLRRE
jgi:hypothetical protein